MHTGNGLLARESRRELLVLPTHILVQTFQARPAGKDATTGRTREFLGDDPIKWHFKPSFDSLKPMPISYKGIVARVPEKQIHHLPGRSPVLTAARETPAQRFSLPVQPAVEVRLFPGRNPAQLNLAKELPSRFGHAVSALVPKRRSAWSDPGQVGMHYPT